MTTMVAGLSMLNARRIRSKELLHLSEFWASLSTMAIISFIFQGPNEDVVALSLFGWLWPLKTIQQLIKDISGKDVFKRELVVVLIIGGLLSFALATYHFTFSIYTLPFCLAFGITGVVMMRQIIFVHFSNENSVFGNVTFILLGLFFMIRLLFPFWRLSENFLMFGLLAHILIIVGLAASTVSFYIEALKVRHEKELESSLKERNQQLLSQSKYSELGMMSAGIAHEINNPLAIIQAKVTQLLRIYRDPQKQKEMGEGLEQVLFTSERINRTIQGIREFVHQDERLPNEEIPLKTLIGDVLAFCGQRMKNHGISLRFYGIDQCSIRGHKIQLEQVILNLLNNSFDAIEFLPEKWIEISVQETGDRIQLFFKDSGPGIAPEIARRIMEPFFTTKSFGKGTGLGLAMAKGIIEKHGGTITYIADAHHTTFMIELPKVSLPIERSRVSEQPTIH